MYKIRGDKPALLTQFCEVPAHSRLQTATEILSWHDCPFGGTMKMCGDAELSQCLEVATGTEWVGGGGGA